MIHLVSQMFFQIKTYVKFQLKINYLLQKMSQIIEAENPTTNTGEKSNFLSDGLKFLPLFSLLLFALSISKQILYYYYFNLDILSFLDLNEVVVEYINSLLVTLLFFICTVGLTFIMVRSLRKQSKLYRRFTDKIMASNQSLILFFFILLVSLLTSIGYVRYYLNLSTYEFDEWVKVAVTEYLMSLFVIIFLAHIPIFLLEKGYITFNFSHIFTYVFILLLIAFTVVDGRNLSFYKKVNSSYGTSFKIGNNIYKSTPTYYYIGKTKNYVFYFNAINESTTAYQMKDITSLNIINLSRPVAKDSIRNYYKRILRIP